MISVFGSINLDLIFGLDRLPSPGETVLGPGVRIEPGGKGANQAVAAARDGAEVVMAGAVGRDPLADAALALLRAEGVDLRRVAAVDEATGCAAVCTDPVGRNLIAVGAGANRLASAEQVEDALLGPGCTLLLQMETPQAENEALIARARAGGARVILNLAPALPIAATGLRAVDVLIVNEHEAAWLAARLAAEASAAGLYAALGVTVVRTLGESGAEFAGSAGLGTIPAFPVAAVDTTAAGDCFTGVLAAALERGLPFPAAIRRANAASALCCSQPGSQGSLPNAAATDGLLGT